MKVLYARIILFNWLIGVISTILIVLSIIMLMGGLASYNEPHVMDIVFGISTLVLNIVIVFIIEIRLYKSIKVRQISGLKAIVLSVLFICVGFLTIYGPFMILAK